MDPVTHTFVGAGLAATDLGRTTRHATAALVIGANLPDIDVLSYFHGADFALGFRRGWTHGIPALLVLPALLAALLIVWDRWRRHDRLSPALQPRRLLMLCYLACFTHPCLDWLNTYGMRWWMPFRDSWSYGDAVFIVDPWLWLVLGGGWLIGRRASRISGVTAVIVAAAVLALVGNEAPAYLPTVAAVSLALLGAFFWRSWPGWLSGHRAAVTGLLLGLVYIGGMITLHARTVTAVGVELGSRGLAEPRELLVGPVPTEHLVWDVVVQIDDTYRWGRYDWRQGRLLLTDTELTAAPSVALWPRVLASGQSSGFLRWTRMPWIDAESLTDRREVHIMDARYARERRLGFGGTVVTLPPG